MMRNKKNMGQVKTNFTIKNVFNDQSLETVGLVDTGATFVSLPARMITQLGLQERGMRNVRTAAGIVQRKIYRGAEATIGERSASADVLELSDDVPPLIGVLLLEALDLIVDTTNHRLIGNPEHNGEYMVDMF